jgi:hypothetical protein
MSCIPFWVLAVGLVRCELILLGELNSLSSRPSIRTAQRGEDAERIAARILIGESRATRSFPDATTVATRGIPRWVKCRTTLFAGFLSQLQYLHRLAKIVTTDTGPVIGESRPVIGEFRAVIGEFGAVIGKSRAVIGKSRAVIGEFGAVIGKSRAVIGKSRAVIGKSRAVWGNTAPVSGRSKAVLGKTASCVGLLENTPL